MDDIQNNISEWFQVIDLTNMFYLVKISQAREVFSSTIHVFCCIKGTWNQSGPARDTQQIDQLAPEPDSTSWVIPRR